MNIYVGNLNYKVRESDLQKVMEDYGAVTAVKFIKDRETGRFRGIAFVEMEDAELDGAEYFGRNMVVKEARPPKYYLYRRKENKSACSLSEREQADFVVSD